ncbi:hypothetical protein C8R45DRAFT_1075755 [Mycena sanguinolenta]|nr:hypothetical protein C8R45DRAFT_1075755 [Mycena sanguinolenta]
MHQSGFRLGIIACCRAPRPTSGYLFAEMDLHFARTEIRIAGQQTKILEMTELKFQKFNHTRACTEIMLEAIPLVEALSAQWTDCRFGQSALSRPFYDQARRITIEWMVLGRGSMQHSVRRIVSTRVVGSGAVAFVVPLVIGMTQSSRAGGAYCDLDDRLGLACVIGAGEAPTRYASSFSTALLDSLPRLHASLAAADEIALAFSLASSAPIRDLHNLLHVVSYWFFGAFPSRLAATSSLFWLDVPGTRTTTYSGAVYGAASFSRVTEGTHVARLTEVVPTTQTSCAARAKLPVAHLTLRAGHSGFDSPRLNGVSAGIFFFSHAEAVSERIPHNTTDNSDVVCGTRQAPYTPSNSTSWSFGVRLPASECRLVEWFCLGFRGGFHVWGALALLPNWTHSPPTVHFRSGASFRVTTRWVRFNFCSFDFSFSEIYDLLRPSKYTMAEQPTPQTSCAAYAELSLRIISL